MIALVPATGGDFDYGWALYRSGIAPLAIPIGAWFETRERGEVARAFEVGEAALVTWGGQRVGWTHVRPTENALELWQLFVEPKHQRRGIGSRVLRRIQEDARNRGLPVLLAVLANNPARRLYARAGFEVHDRSPHHLYLRWGATPSS